MRERPNGPRRYSNRPTSPRRSWAPNAADEASRRAVEVLRQALAEAESLLVSAAQDVLRAGGDAPAAAGESGLSAVAEYFGKVVDTIAEERRLLSEQVTALRQAIASLEDQLREVRDLVTDLRSPESVPEAAPEAAAETTPPPEAEARFAAGGQGVRVALEPVPGFQDLMDIQRALTALPPIEGASVDGYLNGEARFVLHLREPITADRIAEHLGRATGREVAVREARPEAHRLRLHLGEKL